MEIFMRKNERDKTNFHVSIHKSVRPINDLVSLACIEFYQN